MAVTALVIQNTNPMVVSPESGLVRQGFARDDLFVCVHEQFLTETAAMADIVLPATTFLEHDDIYTAGGHHFLQIGRAMLPPHAECRSNHEVICGLAHRLGAKHPGFAMTAFELIEQTLRASGLPGPEAFPPAGSRLGIWTSGDRAVMSVTSTTGHRFAMADEGNGVLRSNVDWLLFESVLLS